MDKQELVQFVPGVVGSAGALLWMNGTWPRKTAMLFLGIAASHYGSADFSRWIGIDYGLAGFVMGMFSMTAADWIFRMWDVFGGIFIDWVRLKLGLSVKKGCNDESIG